MGSFLKSLLQLVQYLAQLGKWLFCRIGFLTCLLDGKEISFHHSVFFVPATVLGGVRSMRAPMFLAKFVEPLKTDFLGSLLCGSTTGMLGICLVLVRSFLAGLCMGFLRNTCMLNSLERSLKRMHVHGSHAHFICCTDPATGMDTSGEHDLPNQSWLTEHLSASCRHCSLGCSTSRAAARRRHWVALRAVRIDVHQPYGASWAYWKGSTSLAQLRCLETQWEGEK